MRLLGKKSLDLKKAVQMCTMTEIASQLIKKIVGAGDKKKEDLKKFSSKKFHHKSCCKKRHGGRLSNLEKKSEKKNSERPFEPTF